jgi:hypothetical protein
MIGAQMHQRCSRPVHRQRITSRCPCVCVCAPCMVRVVVAPSFSALHLAVAPSCHGMAWHGMASTCIALQCNPRIYHTVPALACVRACTPPRDGDARGAGSIGPSGSRSPESRVARVARRPSRRMCVHCCSTQWRPPTGHA